MLCASVKVFIVSGIFVILVEVGGISVVEPSVKDCVGVKMSVETLEDPGIVEVGEGLEVEEASIDKLRSSPFVVSELAVEIRTLFLVSVTAGTSEIDDNSLDVSIVVCRISVTDIALSVVIEASVKSAVFT